MSRLQSPLNLPKSLQYSNLPTYKYNLRSNVHIIPIESVVYYIFDYNHTLNYIYNQDRKREIVDTHINGKNKVVWIRSLSNK